VPLGHRTSPRNRQNRAATTAGAILRRGPWAAYATAATVLTVVAAPAQAGSGPALAFAPAVRMPTLPGFGGLEPTSIVDKYGNVWVTAHKTYQGVAASPALGRPTPLQSSSWLWVSKDGKTFTSPPGATSIAEQNLFFGDEADLATDRAGNVYSSDLTVVGASFTSWRSSGRGKVSLSHTNPESPVQLALSSDRPFISAGGLPGRVVLTANAQDALTAPGRIPEGDVRPYPVYVSNDGGLTWGPPTLLPTAASFCRPLADVRANNPYLYVACAQRDSPALEMFRSSDGGKTWRSSSMTKTANVAMSAYANWPSLGQSHDGKLYALATHYTATPGPLATNGQQPDVGGTRLTLLSSRDQGRTWGARDVTPARGEWQHVSIAVAPDGRIGLAGYFRPRKGEPLRMRAAVFRPRSAPTASTESSGWWTSSRRQSRCPASPSGRCTAAPSTTPSSAELRQPGDHAREPRWRRADLVALSHDERGL
jgi:hypothetical protein